MVCSAAAIIFFVIASHAFSGEEKLLGKLRVLLNAAQSAFCRFHLGSCGVGKLERL